MEKTKVTHHNYSTRHSKVAKLESLGEPCEVKSISTLNKAAKCDSPSSTAKFCMISGYDSPPCRPVISASQTNENEIEWDLTSPSARKFQQVLKSDKKTSTPNRTPTREMQRKRDLRPRLVLCKKNIALNTHDNVGSDLVDELAALDDLINTEQANQSIGVPMTPPPSVKGSANDSCSKSPESEPSCKQSIH